MTKIIIKKKKNQVFPIDLSLSDVQISIKKNIDDIIDRLGEIGDVSQNLVPSGTPNCIHRMFNILLMSLISFMSKHIPGDRMLKMRDEFQRSVQNDPTIWVLKWKHSVSGNDKLLLRSDDIYVLPDFDVLKPLHLDDNWNLLSLSDKRDFWTRLRQLHTLSELMDIFPEEILVSMDNIVLSFMMDNDQPHSVHGTFDKLTKHILHNDMMVYGIKKLMIRASEYIHQSRIPMAPSFSKLLNKTE